LALVRDLVPRCSRVLDLGCENGELLEALFAERQCRGTGVEIDPDAVLGAISRGVPVIELDIDRQLNQFGDKSYDVVVLSRTIQTIRRPESVLQEMARIGGLLIVSVPNFGWWGHRLRLLRGRMPMSKELPYEWYNTPNLRFTTLDEIEQLFVKCRLTIERRITLGIHGDRRHGLDAWANWQAGAAIYALRAA
jgi:methionine biosynthesis protein MetW